MNEKAVHLNPFRTRNCNLHVAPMSIPNFTKEMCQDQDQSVTHSLQRIWFGQVDAQVHQPGSQGSVCQHFLQQGESLLNGGHDRIVGTVHNIQKTLLREDDCRQADRESIDQALPGLVAVTEPFACHIAIQVLHTAGTPKDGNLQVCELFHDLIGLEWGDDIPCCVVETGCWIRMFKADLEIRIFLQHPLDGRIELSVVVRGMHPHHLNCISCRCPQILEIGVVKWMPK
mmetsp:Transcript_53784/g.117782  ORF Transcript_53784/g.117782 Transcript_53784/m.117782 type:complete len:229 (-) Transcript_53784:1134-1820(-)